ncbi:MAG TPA: Ig-like domain-containing protein [Polyangiaceae bacterium]|nr:Ig-like domain-containing protein [Polyangiaceae bacterium]
MMRRTIFLVGATVGGSLVPFLLAATTGCSCSSSDSHATGAGQKDGGLGDGGLVVGGFSISPNPASLDVDPGSGKPATLQFTVTGASPGQVTWKVSNPYLGSVDSNGLFTASGLAAGEGDITATFGGQTVTVHIVITIAETQNGDADANAADAGVGGLGGVGGEGFGGSVPDDVLAILKGTPSADAALAMLYPYDQTVFPLDLLPPLLQWKEGQGPADAVYIHLSAPPYYDYRGYFGRPAGLAAGASFVRHPIPKDVWTAATRAAAGSVLSLEVVVASGGKAYGPMKQSYKIALAPINGKIYYQAYNTVLAHNYQDQTKSGVPMGGATLSISVGEPFPRLVAGKTSTDHSGCRVCHSVSAYGDRMIVQHGDDYTASSTYDLKNGNVESTPYQNATMAWVGLYPDGSLGLSNNVEVGGPNQADPPAALYDMTSGAVVPTTGLTDFATSIGLPSFSPDGKHVAFTLFEGASNAAVGPANGRKLVGMDFDLATKAFSNPKLLWESTTDTERPGFNTFLPTSAALVFQRRFAGTTNEIFASRDGARGELWWLDLASGQVAPLDLTNGMGAGGTPYLPNSGPNHDRDDRLNYEPSISPVASGGYAWMVFMSRRAYGNVATADPWHSDPRDYDIEKDVTTKKIWMAAIDLEPTPGKDPSHPAFYIPGQELHGVNSRPFFALSPCVSDRGTCRTGVDCCSGFCRDGLCAPPPVSECSKIDEKCSATSDCCDLHARCIGGFCAVRVQ